jgi:hypothetical protein
MKFFAIAAGAAGLVVAAAGANAQMMAPYDAGRAHFQTTSDFDGPYGPPPVPPAPAPAPRPYGYGYGPGDDGYGPRYGGPQYGYGPELMPLPEVYAVLRDNGFSPLGIPHQRGFIYVIAAIDRSGQDGRLVIDGRSGQIIRFTPAYRWGLPLDRMHYQPGPPPASYGAQAALPPPTVIRAAPTSPAPVPHIASRAVPMPQPKPVTAAKSAEAPQQSAAVETRPAVAPPAAQATAAPPQASATTGQAKPAPQILPTQQMPKVQGLE